jgi:methenyltetrahydrofolate cyclohydrolase
LGDLAERPLRELLAAVAERTPAPGGGYASALTGAMAAALLEMAAAFAGDSESVERATALRGQLLHDGERELGSYQPVLDAMRLPLDDPARGEHMETALSEASEAPLEIARASAEVAELAAAVAARSTPTLAGDAIAAVVLAEASSRAAARLVEINLRDSGDPRLEEVAELAKRAATARSRALGDSPTR